MHLIKVDAINSTNSFARELFRENPRLPLTCIVAGRQLEGRGQRGSTWLAEEGKNLTFSVFLPKPDISPSHQFLLSAAVAVALLETLIKFHLPQLRVKWPNDILSANKKIAGVLIENILSEGKIAASIIGIGLNVNQVQFDDLPQASSMKLILGKEQSLDLVLETFLEVFKVRLQTTFPENSRELLERYEKSLFRRDLHSTFELPQGKIFTGVIQGVNSQGKLLVKEENELKEFDLKEIKLRY